MATLHEVEQAENPGVLADEVATLLSGLDPEALKRIKALVLAEITAAEDPIGRLATGFDQSDWEAMLACIGCQCRNDGDFSGNHVQSCSGVDILKAHAILRALVDAGLLEVRDRNAEAHWRSDRTPQVRYRLAGSALDEYFRRTLSTPTACKAEQG